MCPHTVFHASRPSARAWLAGRGGLDAEILDQEAAIECGRLNFGTLLTGAASPQLASRQPSLLYLRSTSMTRNTGPQPGACRACSLTGYPAGRCTGRCWPVVQMARHVLQRCGGWVRRLPSLNEFFVHHEGVRRAERSGPRT